MNPDNSVARHESGFYLELLPILQEEVEEKILPSVDYLDTKVNVTLYAVEIIHVGIEGYGSRMVSFRYNHNGISFIDGSCHRFEFDNVEKAIERAINRLKEME